MVRSLQFSLVSIATAFSFGLLSIPTTALAQGGGDPTIPDPDAWVRLGISNFDGTLTDELTVNFAVGEPGSDVLDIPKIDDLNIMPLYIATLGVAGTPLALNAHGPYTQDVTLPVQFMAVNADVYTLTVLDLGSLEGKACVSLEDLETGEIIILTPDLELPLEIPAGPPVGPRYKLHVFMPVSVEVTGALCPHGSLGSATVTGTGYGPWQVSWLNYEDLVISEENSATSPIDEGGLYPGNWTALVENQDGCGVFQVPFVITVPEPIAIASAAEATSCAESADGRIDLEPSGGVAPYTYEWSTGATAQDLEQVPAGSYHVTVADANGCTTTFHSLVVQSPGPIAGAIIAEATAERYEQLQFTSTAGPGVQRVWDFGDGSGSILPEPQHAYQNLGIFTVTLTLTEGACQTIVQSEVLVQSSVGVHEYEGDEVRAWSSAGLITVANPLNVDLHIHIFDATGRVVLTKRVPAQSGRTEIVTNSWTKGLYFLNASTAWEQWTFSLPVVE